MYFQPGSKRYQVIACPSTYWITIQDQYVNFSLITDLSTALSGVMMLKTWLGSTFGSILIDKYQEEGFSDF